MVSALLFLLLTFTANAAQSSLVAGQYEDLEKRLGALQKDFKLLRHDLRGVKRMVDIVNVCEGRLTLLSGSAVPTADQANRSTLYFTPHRGNRIALYNGTNWTLYSFTEISLALAGLTANRNYDVFIYNNAGTPTLELTAWSTNTTRATALLLQDGIYLRTGATTRRYVGTIRATAANQTQDTERQRFVWNYQNPVARYFYVTDGTNSWTYTTNNWRSANNSTANRVEVVIGLAETLVEARVMSFITNGSGTLNYFSSGVGIDTTTVNSASIRGAGSNNAMYNQVWGEYRGYPGIGYHFLQWVERGAGTSITVYGDNGDNTRYRSGLLGELNG